MKNVSSCIDLVAAEEHSKTPADRIKHLQKQVNHLMRRAFVEPFEDFHPFERMRTAVQDFRPFERMRDSARRARERMESTDLAENEIWPTVFGKDVEWIPSVDVRETSDGSQILVSAEVPGMKSNDITVEFNENIMTISGTRSKTYEATEGNVHWEEISSGYFQRSLRLPPGIDSKSAQARYSNGVLEVKVPKLTSSESKVSVKVHEA